MILFSLSLLGWMLAAQTTLRMPAALAPVTAITLITLILYVFGLADMLPQGRTLLSYGGNILLPLVLLSTPAEERKSIVRSPGFLLFLVIAVLSYFKLRTSTFSNNDEFSHWGLIAKELFLNDSLVKSNFITEFKTYPPASAVWQYFVLFRHPFNEGLVNFAQSILLFAPLCALFTPLQWSQKRLIALTLVAMYLALFTFGHGVKTTLIDHVLGVYFGAAFAVYLLSTNRKRYLTLALILALLPLLKSAGLLLAIIAALFITLDSLFISRERPWAYLLLCWSALFASYFSWQHYLATNDLLIGAFSDYSTQQTIASLFHGQLSQLQQGIVRDFMHAFMFEGVARSPRVWSTPLFWLIFFGLMAWTVSRRQAHVKVRFAFLSAGLLVFSIGLLSLYLFTFGEYEARILAAFGRYMGIYFLGLAVALMALFIKDPPQRIFKSSLGLFVLVMAVAAPWKAYDFMLRGEKPSKNLKPVQAALESSHIESLAGPQESVYVIWQNAKGYEHWALRYQLAPRTVNAACSNLGPQTDEQDVWSCDKTPGELAAVLSRYDTVWIARSDARLSEKYGEVLARHPHVVQ